jgi:hypothetical protein
MSGLAILHGARIPHRFHGSFSSRIGGAGPRLIISECADLISLVQVWNRWVGLADDRLAEFALIL